LNLSSWIFEVKLMLPDEHIAEIEGLRDYVAMATDFGNTLQL